MRSSAVELGSLLVHGGAYFMMGYFDFLATWVEISLP